jgi:hypothetical protein
MQRMLAFDRGIDEACLRRAATTIGGKRGCA